MTRRTTMYTQQMTQAYTTPPNPVVMRYPTNPTTLKTTPAMDNLTCAPARRI